MNTRRWWTENALWMALLPVIGEGLAGYPNVRVARAFQPTMQAESSQIQALLHRARSRLAGAQGSLQEYDKATAKLHTHETWRKEDTYRVTVVCPPDTGKEAVTAKDATRLLPGAALGGSGGHGPPSAKDVLETLLAHMQSEATITALARQGLGILRISDIQETPQEGSSGHWEFQQMLEFVITYTQTKTSETPVVARFEAKIARL